MPIVRNISASNHHSRSSECDNPIPRRGAVPCDSETGRHERCRSSGGSIRIAWFAAARLTVATGGVAVKVGRQLRKAATEAGRAPSGPLLSTSVQHLAADFRVFSRFCGVGTTRFHKFLEPTSGCVITACENYPPYKIIGRSAFNAFGRCLFREREKREFSSSIEFNSSTGFERTAPSSSLCLAMAKLSQSR